MKDKDKQKKNVSDPRFLLLFFGVSCLHLPVSLQDKHKHDNIIPL